MKPILRTAVLVLLPLCLVLVASAATAIEPISPATASAGGGEGEAANACPTLTQLKYPFLRCRTNAWGGRTLDSAGVRSEGVPQAVPEFHTWSWDD